MFTCLIRYHQLEMSVPYVLEGLRNARRSTRSVITVGPAPHIMLLDEVGPGIVLVVPVL